MDSMNYPGNRQVPQQRVFSKQGDDEKQEEGKPRATRIVNSRVITRRQPLSKRLLQTFFGGDGRNAWQYILQEVVVPAAKDMLLDSISQGADKIIHGDNARTVRRGNRSGSGRQIDYNRISSQRSEPRAVSRYSRANHDFREIVLEGRGEAEHVISQMFDILEQYNMVSVSDMYEMVGIVPAFTDEKWGWTELRGASIRRVRNGYLLDLPRPEPLD